MKRWILTSAIVGCLFMASCRETKVKMEKGTPKLLVGDRLASPLVLYATMRPAPSEFTVSGDWQEYRLAFESPETDRGGAAVHVRSGLDKGDLWVDDVKFVCESDGKNLIREGDFTHGQPAFEKEWQTFINKGQGVDASVVESGALRFSVQKPGKNMHDAHVYQTGHTVEKGKKYVISARMKASAPRRADFLAVHQGEPWTQYAIHPPKAWHEIELAAGAGIHIHSFGLHMPWPKPGEAPNFSGVGRTMEEFIKHDPRGMLIPRIGMEAPGWWTRENPDDCMLYDAGERGGSSVASEKWRRDATANLCALVAYLEENHGDHVLGYHPCGQNTGEWFYRDSWMRKLCGFSPAMGKGFQKWLREKYANDIAALNRAWGGKIGDFAAVDVPTKEERLEALAGAFRDPIKQRKVVDFTEYMQVAMIEPLEMFAKAIKEASSRKKCVVFFYGYLFEFGPLWAGAPNSGHYALRRMLDCPDVDILCSPISYGDRGLGGIGAFMVPVDSIQMHGKLWLNEDDTRTHISPADAHKTDPAWHGRVDTPEQTWWVHQRNFGHIFVRRAACWWMDLPGLGWLDSKDIWDNIAKLRGIYDEGLERGSQYKSEVAIIIDEKSAFYLKPSPHVTGDLIYRIRMDFYRMGLPFGMYLLDDLVDGKVPDAKFYIFLNAFCVTRGQRDAIHRIVRRGGRTALWFYAPGIISDGGLDVNNMEALTGIRLMPLPSGIVPDATLVASGDPIGAGLKAGDVFGPQDKSAIETIFAAVEPQAGMAVLARYHAAKNTAAVVVKRQENWTSVFCGSTRLPARVFRAVARDAGAHVWVDSDDVFATDGRFLALQASEAGRKTIHLPAAGDMGDAVTKNVIAKNVLTIDLDLKKGETRMFLVGEGRD
ncbi:MAG: carbohydrate binding domain-containing protein [Planctomycetota bacterium]